MIQKLIKIDSKIVLKLIQNVFKNEPTMGAQIHKVLKNVSNMDPKMN